jgi:hypothetical protein
MEHCNPVAKKLDVAASEGTEIKIIQLYDFSLKWRIIFLTVRLKYGKAMENVR